MIGYFFRWFNGAIWGNLVASLIWAVPAYLIGRRRHKHIHRRLTAQDDKLEQMHQHIRSL